MFVLNHVVLHARINVPFLGKQDVMTYHPTGKVLVVYTFRFILSEHIYKIDFYHSSTCKSTYITSACSRGIMFIENYRSLVLSVPTMYMRGVDATLYSTSLW